MTEEQRDEAIERITLAFNDPDPRGFHVSQAAFWRRVIDEPTYEGEADVARQIVAESELIIAAIDAQSHNEGKAVAK